MEIEDILMRNEQLVLENEALRQQIEDLKNGFEGCCPVCEPVGEMNKKLRKERDEARRELGQVSDADSWVSKADAAHLDSLLNWCEFNDMESHRALQRLVNDRARLRGEVTRLRKERDEARRMWCKAAPVGNSLSVNDMDLRARAEATRRGWDCFKEEKTNV